MLLSLIHIYLVLSGDAAQRAGLALAERLRDEAPGLRLRMHCGGGSFKSQFRRADASGAQFALVLGEDELAARIVTIKPLRAAATPQLTLPEDQAVAYLQAALQNSQP